MWLSERSQTFTQAVGDHLHIETLQTDKINLVFNVRIVVSFFGNMRKALSSVNILFLGTGYMGMFVCENPLSCMLMTGTNLYINNL